MKNTLTRLWRPGLLMAGLLVASVATVSAGNLVTNGGFETISSGSTNLDFEGSTVLTGWTTFAAGTSFLDCVANPSTATSSGHGLCGTFSFSSSLAMDKTPVASPNGGNYVLADGDPSDESAIQQTVSGLTAGKTYTVNFLQAAGEQTGFGTAGTNASVQWMVCLTDATTAISNCNATTGGGQTSSAMTFPENAGTSSTFGWQMQNLFFVAPSSKVEISFFAIGPVGAPPFAMLDGVQLYQGTPEPGTLTMFAIGTLMLFGAARFRGRRKRS